MFVIDSGRRPCACCARTMPRSCSRSRTPIARTCAAGCRGSISSTSEEDSRSFLATVTAQREDGRGPTFGILQRRCARRRRRVLADRPRQSRRRDRLLARRPQSQGRGVMTQCCRFVVRYGFPHARPESHPDRGRHRQSREPRDPRAPRLQVRRHPARPRESLRHVHRSRDVLAAAQRVRRDRQRDRARACWPRAGLPK